MGDPIRKCVECGRFIYPRPGKLFCGSACRVANHRLARECSAGGDLLVISEEGRQLMIPGPIADDEVEATVARIAERGFVVHADAIRTASAFVARYQGQHAEYDDGDIAELENSPLADTKEEQVEKWRREVANVRARYGSSVSQGFARAAARAIEAGVKIAGKPRN